MTSVLSIIPMDPATVFVGPAPVFTAYMAFGDPFNPEG